MTRNRKKALLAVFSICLLFSCGFYYLNRPKNLNVLLITIDSLRADHLSCYGYRRNTSPNMDKLAREGALFLEAIAQSSHTPTSMSSIATSVMPKEHSVLDWGYTLNPQIPTLPEILKKHGYRTIFVGAHFSLRDILCGFGRGFDVSNFDHPPEDVTPAVLRQLGENSTRPFFLWAHYMDVHSPYRPSEEFKSLFIDDAFYNSEKRDLPVVPCRGGGFGYHAIGGISSDLVATRGGITDLAYYIAQYDAAIRTVDEDIARILNELKSSGLDKNTLIIISADHGELLGEHDAYFLHGGRFLYEPLLRVPLIMKCDRVIPKNRIINAQVSASIDIAPTILEILKVKKPRVFQGVNLIDIIYNKKQYPCSYVYADEGKIARCIRTEEWKLIIVMQKGRNREYELYRLKADPQEINNTAFLERDTLGLLSKKLDVYIKDAYPFKKVAMKQTLSGEARRKLLSLGYVQ